MENHPIPQDITGFQFKLIGNMTIKQFGYLATGSVLAWVFFSSHIFILLRLPLALIFAMTGVSFAFLPIEGRPLDTMLSHFIHAMFSPTQFVYEKTGGSLYTPPLHPKKHKKESEKKEDVRIVAPVSAPPVKKEDEEKKEMVFFSSLSSLRANTPAIQAAPAAAPNVVASHAYDLAKGAPVITPASAPTNQTEKEKQMEQKEQELEKELALAHQKEVSQDPTQAKEAHQEILSIEEELRKTVGEKNKLEQQLVELNKKLDQQKASVFTPGVVQAPKETQNVRVIPQGLGRSVGLPIAPDSPNVISGIVKDPRGNPLSNILVEVKDQDSNPVRAFKTNGVGQFASATALTNGIYTIDFEDPKEENKFDTIQFEAKGEIILPIEVISTDKREELRRELFN